MINKNNKLILIGLFLLLLFIILPTSFALDNETIILDTDSSQDEISQNSDLNLVGNQNDEILSGDNDYYFNASVEKDGDGSKENPYKYFTADKIRENSNIYLANGNYELDKSKSINRLSIFGEDAQNTIIKFKNVSDFLTVSGTLTLQNVTLQDVSIKNYGTVNASNTIFKDAVAASTVSSATDLVNSATNSFGGAIYSPYYEYSTAYVYINNCTFINNTAEYGGAIYMYGGYLDIKNSVFLNNYAYNYGGAIACEYSSKVTIDDSKFKNSKSLNDAGGAIYLKSSKLTANYVNITDSYATFGSAITSLDSTLAIESLNAINNIANYEGGAIYQLYGSFSLKSSKFIKNSARNGGALFIDETTSTTIYQNEFINNSASDSAGAIYSLLNTKSRFMLNNYTDNSAKYYNDLLETKEVSLVIGDGNYSMYMFNSSYDGVLPDYYNLLNLSFVTTVKDQQSGGNCWAFAGIAVLESCILKASGDNLDLSEENMKNLIELYSDYGWNMDTNQGGYDEMVLGYLLSWMGPIFEDIDNYDDYSTLSPLLKSIMHVQNVKYLKRSSYTDNDEIKKAIMTYGAVSTGFYYDSTYFNTKTSAYNNPYASYSNHAVAIVGWDDNYSRKNFLSRPTGDGAWIVKNSWNTDWGDNGYFYVSYYDSSFIPVGDNEAAYTFILNDTMKYDKNYQYDIIGKTDYFFSGNKNIWYKNIFEATGDEFLAAVATYFEKACEWDLSVYVNNVLKLTKNGTTDAGYYTIDLGNYIPLKNGDKFEVVFKITSSSASFPISEKIRSNKVLYKEGVSFFSNNGKTWTDLYDYIGTYSSHSYQSQVACIKAFTFIDEIKSSTSLNVSDKGYNPIDIVANVVNQYGYPVTGGNVTFTISNQKFIVPVSNGIAKLTIDLAEMSVTDIVAVYNGIGFIPSFSTDSVNITKVYAKINTDVVQNMTKATINIDISKSLNETLLITVNNDTYLVNSTNGKASLVLNDLDSGNYSVSVVILNDTIIFNDNLKEFSINVKKTEIIAEDFISYYNGGNIYAIQLADINGNPVVNREITVEYGGNVFKKKTDSDGIAYMSVTLPVGVYYVKITFDGDNDYINSSISKIITVKSTILPPASKNYLLNTKYYVSLLDNEGNPLNNTSVVVMINGVKYNKISNSEGQISVDINLKPGTYSLVVNNPINDEKFNTNIKVIPRITSNKDLTMYFLNGASYKVRVFGDDGKAVGAGQIVVFKVSGKTYNVKTDKNGYASLKINLNPKTYTITATYKGYKVSNKIVVKPVLTAKSISKKKAKVVKFSAKLVNGNGKVLKSKKIIFKVKGKKYSAKTNVKGIATISLKNFKVGKYTVITTYGKSTIKNIITIKK